MFSIFSQKKIKWKDTRCTQVNDPNFIPCFFLRPSFILSSYTKRENRKVVRKGIYKKGYRKGKGSTPINVNLDLTYTVIFVIL